MTDYTHNYKELPSAFFVLQKTGGSRGGEGRGQGGQGTGTGVSPWVSLEGCPPPVPLLSEWWGVGGKKRESRLTARRVEGRGVVVAHVVRPPRRGVRRQEVGVVPVVALVRASARHDVVLTSGLGAEDGAETAKKRVAKKTFFVVVAQEEKKCIFYCFFGLITSHTLFIN